MFKPPKSCTPCNPPVAIPTCNPTYAGPITIVPNNCNYNWSVTPADVMPGQQVVITFTGLPQGQSLVKLTGPNTNFVISIYPDRNGYSRNSVLMPSNDGTYEFEPVVLNCNPDTKCRTVRVLGCNTSVPTCNCTGGVTVVPSFASDTVASGAPIALKLTITNTNTCPISDLYIPAIALPPGLVGGPIELTSMSIGGNQSVVKTFILVATNNEIADNNVAVVIPSDVGTYKCNGTLSFSGGGQTNTIIRSSITGTCSISIERFDFTPSSIINGGTSTVTAILKNSGTSILSNINFGPFRLDNGTIVTISPSETLTLANGTLQPNETVTISQTVAFTATEPPTTPGSPIVHQLVIPIAAITANCNSQPISSKFAASATLLIMQAATP